jgi:hypothetical protein
MVFDFKRRGKWDLSLWMKNLRVAGHWSAIMMMRGAVPAAGSKCVGLCRAVLSALASLANGAREDRPRRCHSERVTNVIIEREMEENVKCGRWSRSSSGARG